MPYSPTTWVDDSSPDIDAANLNNLEDGVSKAAYAPDASSGFVPVGDGSGAWVYKKLTTSELDAAAGILATQLAGSIPYSKLALNAGDIPYSKLALAASLLESDFGFTDVTTANSTTAHHGLLPKLDGSSSKALLGDGTWGSLAASSILDFAQITSNVAATATSEGTAVTVIAGNSITYPNSRVKIEFTGIANASAALQATFVFLRDSTVLGKFQIGIPSSGGGGRLPVALACYDTPSAGAHTYTVKVWVSTSTVTIIAGAGGSATDLPATLLVSKAS